MGYNTRIKHSTAMILAENKDEVLQIWKDLNSSENDHLKRGGAYRDGSKHTAWFSWMPANYDQTVTSADDVLSELGFETALDPDGNILICEYDSKRGQEDLFFKHASHLIKGQIMWEGEDGSTWVWELGKQLAIEQDD
jgi:hypothetical protein